jgi:hypothetical protein
MARVIGIIPLHAAAVINFLIARRWPFEGTTVVEFQEFWLWTLNLKSATVNAVAEVCCDQTDSPFFVDIILTWTGTGPVSSGKTTTTSKSPGCKTTITTHGESRPAMATGSVEALGIDFAPQPTNHATIGLYKEGNLVVGCN